MPAGCLSVFGDICCRTENIEKDLLNPLNASSTKWSNILKQFELFECVWSFRGVGA